MSVMIDSRGRRRVWDLPLPSRLRGLESSLSVVWDKFPAAHGFCFRDAIKCILAQKMHELGMITRALQLLEARG